jgi:hypothetical protein
MPIRVDAQSDRRMNFTASLGDKHVEVTMTHDDEGTKLRLYPEGRDIMISAPLANLRVEGQRQTVAETYRIVERVSMLLRDDTPAVVMCREELIMQLFVRAGLVRGAP